MIKVIIVVFLLVVTTTLFLNYQTEAPTEKFSDVPIVATQKNNPNATKDTENDGLMLNEVRTDTSSELDQKQATRNSISSMLNTILKPQNYEKEKIDVLYEKFIEKKDFSLLADEVTNFIFDENISQHSKVNFFLDLMASNAIELKSQEVILMLQALGELKPLDKAEELISLYKELNWSDQLTIEGKIAFFDMLRQSWSFFADPENMSDEKFELYVSNAEQIKLFFKENIIDVSNNKEIINLSAEYFNMMATNDEVYELQTYLESNTELDKDALQALKLKIALFNPEVGIADLQTIINDNEKLSEDNLMYLAENFMNMLNFKKEASVDYEIYSPEYLYNLGRILEDNELEINRDTLFDPEEIYSNQVLLKAYMYTQIEQGIEKVEVFNRMFESANLYERTIMISAVKDQYLMQYIKESGFLTEVITQLKADNSLDHQSDLLAGIYSLE